jgi:hypothetical protein
VVGAVVVNIAVGDGGVAVITAEDAATLPVHVGNGGVFVRAVVVDLAVGD